MIDINKEAEEYAESSLLKRKAAKHFIAGYNSKSTQAKVLQAQIDILKEYSDYYWNKTSTERIIKHIEILQQQLEQLQNG
jgi:hypothetical protein